ncbi:hypothetical protein Tco_1428670 [Tanacetum coccineum]
MQERDQNTATDGIRDVYLTDSSQGEVNGHFHPVRVHVRGTINGLAGIGFNTFCLFLCAVSYWQQKLPTVSCQGTSNTDETDGWTFSGVSVQMMGE